MFSVGVKQFQDWRLPAQGGNTAVKHLLREPGVNNGLTGMGVAGEQTQCNGSSNSLVEDRAKAAEGSLPPNDSPEDRGRVSPVHAMMVQALIHTVNYGDPKVVALGRHSSSRVWIQAIRISSDSKNTRYSSWVLIRSNYRECQYSQQGSSKLLPL